MEKQRNNSIDIFRYVCAILVVIIHTEPWFVQNYPVGFALRDIYARVAVPFFFVVSGYFYAKKVSNGAKALVPFVKNLLITYLIWSVPYWMINMWVWYNARESLGYILGRLVRDFFIFGSFSHFWFFCALIYAAIMYTVLRKIIGEKAMWIIAILLYVVGCLGSAYYKYGNEIPVLRDLYNLADFTAIRRIFMTGFSFFVLGDIITRVEERCSAKKTGKATTVLSILIVVLYVCEKLIIVCGIKGYTDVVNTIFLYPLVAVIFLWLLRHPMKKAKELGTNARMCANFIYYIHWAFILVITRVWPRFFGASISSEALFFMTSGVLTVVGFLFAQTKVGKKIIV